MCVCVCVCVCVCRAGGGVTGSLGKGIGNAGCRGEEVGLGVKERGPLFVGNLAQPHWGTGGTSSELPHPWGEDLGHSTFNFHQDWGLPWCYLPGISSLPCAWGDPLLQPEAPSGRGDFGDFEGSSGLPEDSDCPQDIAGHQQQLLSFLNWRNLYHGSTPAELCQVKDANLRKLHIVQFHLHGFLERSKLWGQKTDPWLPRAGEGWGVIKGNSLGVDEDVVVQDSTFVSIHRTTHLRRTS